MKIDNKRTEQIKATFEHIKADLTTAVSAAEDYFRKSLEMLRKTLFKKETVAKSKEQITELTEEVERVMPLINQIGYKTREVRIGIGVPPVLEIYYQKIKDVDRKEINQILKDNKDDTAFRLIAKALLSADTIHKKINKVGNQKFKEVILTLTLPPRVTLMYVA